MSEDPMQRWAVIGQAILQPDCKIDRLRPGLLCAIRVLREARFDDAADLITTTILEAERKPS